MTKFPVSHCQIYSVYIRFIAFVFIQLTSTSSASDDRVNTVLIYMFPSYGCWGARIFAELEFRSYWLAMPGASSAFSLVTVSAQFRSNVPHSRTVRNANVWFTVRYIDCASTTLRNRWSDLLGLHHVHWPGEFSVASGAIQYYIQSRAPLAMCCLSSMALQVGRGIINSACYLKRPVKTWSWH